MCGIAGYYSKESASAEVVNAMTNVIAHRGPDASGIFIHNGFGIGHRRLSIIDLSHSADQPMHSKCGRYCIVYNGEVYNFREIAAELDNPMSTTGDTEVILEAFAKWGTQMVTKLNGMFSIAILDKMLNKLYIFRDRMGIKPLFIYNSNGLFGFASELKAFKTNQQFKLSINRSAIYSFLNLGYIPEPASIYNEIAKFPSGHYGIFDGRQFQTEPYWNMDGHLNSEVVSDEIEAKNNLRTLLEDSVSKRLMSDVPFGTFLSGGIDSSIVTAFAQKNSMERIKTFSIGFKESSHDESEFAKQVAGYLGTVHHQYTVTEKDALDLIPTVLRLFDEPFADSSALPTMLVSRLARENVTMTLSGDGGDELFHGYGSYKWAERLNRPFWKMGHNLVGAAFAFGTSKYQRISKLLSYDRLTPNHIFSQEQYFFSENEIGQLLNPSEVGSLKLREQPTVLGRNFTPAEQQALFDLKYYLKDDLLTKVDRATMLYSLETRVPILDHRIVEFSMNISPSLKVKNGIQKYILKELLYEMVPKELFDRPKWGFSIPLNKWLLGPLGALIDTYLSEGVVRKSGFVSWSHTETMIKQFRAGKNYLYNRLWLLIVLHYWHLEVHQKYSNDQ